MHIDKATAEKAGVVRILDAEANRAAEGLRVIEDYLRFVLDDRHLTRLAKELRHDLTAALAGIAAKDRLEARESAADVGATLATPSETSRANIADVVAASFKRLQQALRSLEEYAKVADPIAAAAIEPLRYRAYTLERAVGITADSRQRLGNARLYVLLDGRESEAAFTRMAESLVTAGVHVLQLRDKRLGDHELIFRARRLREITRGTQTLFIVNDRPDLAALADADGVHVGQEELSVKDARAIIGLNRLIGVSTHSIEQARQAVLDGANYIGVGPMFQSTTKSFDAFAGLELIRAVAAEISLPAFAIGGITRENLPQVQAAGLNRIAVSGAVLEAADPAAAAKELLSTLDSPSPPK
jgi:thiamine-phosphate pyrophosphorylase